MFGIMCGCMIIILFLVFVLQGSASDAITQKKENNHMSIMKGEHPQFQPTKAIYRDFSNYVVYIDENSEKIMIVELLLNYRNIVHFNEIIECTVMQDGATVLSSGTGNAIIGGIIGGTTGAIIGSASRESKPVALSLSIRIVTNNIKRPLYEIPIISSSVERTSEIYKKQMQFAQEIYATMISIINNAKTS